MIVELERLELVFAEDGASKTYLDTYSRLTGTLRRILRDLGLERRARDVTPTLDQYLRAKAETAE